MIKAQSPNAPCISFGRASQHSTATKRAPNEQAADLLPNYGQVSFCTPFSRPVPANRMQPACERGLVLGGAVVVGRRVPWFFLLGLEISALPAESARSRCAVNSVHATRGGFAPLSNGREEEQQNFTQDSIG